MHLIHTFAVTVAIVVLLAVAGFTPVIAQTQPEAAEPPRITPVGSRTHQPENTTAYPGMTLPEAVETALIKNAHLRAATAQVRRSEAGVQEARSSLLPDLVATGEYTRSEEPTLVNPMHGTPTPQDPLTFDDEIYTGILRLNIPVLNLPALAGVRASRHLVDVRYAERAKNEQRIIGAVTEVFVQSGQIRDNLNLLDSHIRALERRLVELRTLSEAGRVSPSSVSEVEATTQSLRAERIELEYRHDELAFRLASLLGQDHAVVPVVPAFREAPPIGASTDGSGAAGPAWQAAEAHYLAAEASRSAARASFAPSVNGFAAQSSRSGSDIDFTNEWSLGLTVTVPLVTGGERLARLNAAEADVEAARHNRASARTAEITESRLLVQRWERAAEREELLAAAAVNQERAVRAVEDRFNEGRASLSDLLTEETTLLELRMHIQSTRYDRLLAYVAHAEIAGALSPALITSLIEE
ncbi:MAG: TolC family protein [Alkalispirochaeta sp.]